MRITARQDVAAPIAEVFAAATDHAGFERQALRRGADLRRTDRPAPEARGRLAAGAAWRVSFPFRGREREAEIRVERVEAPTLVAGIVEGGGLAARSAADLLPLSRGTTRLTVTIDVEGRSLAARLLQGLKLARGSFQRKAEERLAAWARDVEAQWQRRSAGGTGAGGAGAGMAGSAGGRRR